MQDRSERCDEDSDSRIRLDGRQARDPVGTVPSEVFVPVFEARGKANPPSMVYCGDEDGAKDVAATLISDIGFEPVDAGPLRIARYLEPFALLMGQLAHEGDGGPAIAYRFERFEE